MASKFYTGTEQAGAEHTVEGNYGVVFTVQQAGVSITHVQFYRPTIGTNNVTVRLWTAAGALLATASGSVSGAGWHEVALSAPVNLTNGTSYIVTWFGLAGDRPMRLAPGVSWPRTAGSLATSGTTTPGRSPTGTATGDPPTVVTANEYFTGPVLEVAAATSVTRDIHLTLMTLWFVIPAHGRLALTAICLRQLRRTCDALCEEGIEASAVVTACDENLSTARELGFGTVERSNQFLSRRFNDGIQLACDPAYNPRPVDYVVPLGSDDWVDHRLLLDLPPADTVLAFRRLSFVREDGREMTARHLSYAGGCGIRIYPRQVLARLDYRPADEDRRRGCDTSILRNLAHAGPPLRVIYGDTDARQIVDWKTPGEQLNGYGELQGHRALWQGDPFEELADVFGTEALEEMAGHYRRVREPVPA